MTCLVTYFYSFGFFFQAEDGIRDGHVTGVQTCALPICRAWNTRRSSRITDRTSHIARRRSRVAARAVGASGTMRWCPRRSEERRVGKECRSRGTADYNKKYTTQSEQSRVATSRVTKQQR